jgi:antitoxin component of MazEF toxin-antitoxin module
MPAKVERKILEIGKSKATALPPDWLRALKLGIGDSVEMLYNFIVIIKPKNVKLDPVFLSKELEILAALEAEMPMKEKKTMEEGKENEEH